MRPDELNFALIGLTVAERRVRDFEGGAPAMSLRLAVTECVMWADMIREELGLDKTSGIAPRSLTIDNMPWHLFGGRLTGRADRERAVQLIHGFRWARHRALHERLTKVDGVGGGFPTPVVTPIETSPADRWLWGDTSEARPQPPDPLGDDGYRTRLLGREVAETIAEIRRLYEKVVIDSNIRVLVDSDAFDGLAEDDSVLALVTDAVQRGALTIFCTDITEREVALARSPKREALQRLPRERIVAAIGVLADEDTLDVPVEDLDRRARRARHAGFVLDDTLLASDEASALFDAVLARTGGSEPDAVAAVTARHHDLVLVCIDGRLRTVCAQHQVKTMTPSELIAAIT